jgi:riboflavin biosynthesis pyrimidine reductase
VRQLVPSYVDRVAADGAYAADRRPAPPDRPWVVIGMITSLDGATAIDGRSGAFGSPGDHAVYGAVRAVADVILVGAGTARHEGYGPPALTEAQQGRRRQRGQAPLPRLAVVSGRLDLAPEARLFADGHRPLVLTTERAAADAPAWMRAAADLRPFGDERVDMVGALAGLRDLTGASVVVAEGGPTINATLIDAGVVDEVCLTLASVVAGGASARWTGPAHEVLRPLTLVRVLEEDGYLFLRYVRPDTTPEPAGP